ncbi:MAG: cache domain-containing protein [Desulforhopalus sp.]|nr:cache domain-containing protein [Desulforhopalus sp.]
MKYNSKKTIAIITICSVVILIAMLVNYRLTQHVVETTVIAQQEDIADKAANTVEIWLNQQMKILEAAANSISINDLSQNTATMLPLQMAMQAGHFTDVYIGTPEGELIDGAQWLPPSGYDPRERPWYKRAMETGSLSFTTPYIDMVTNELVIALVKPLRANGRIVGVMGADTVLDTLVENVLNYKQSESGFAFIIEKSGTIIVHPNKDFVMRTRLQIIEPELANKMSSVNGTGNKTLSYRSIDGRDHLLSSKQISGSEWYLCVTVPRDEAFSMTRSTTRVFAMEIVLKLLAFLLFIVLLGLGISSIAIFLYNKRYSTAVQQHREEISGISKDLEWNITKRMEVETYYKTLFNVANDAILISNDLNFVEECNQRAVEMFGLPREELQTKTILDCSPEWQPDGSNSQEKLATIIQDSRNGKQNVFRWSFLREGGSEFPASVSLTSFRMNDRDLVLSSIRDISKRVDAEGQLMQAQKMAAVGEMLGAIAHQWRQPLNTLATYISSLQAAYYNSMLSKEVVERVVTGAGDQIAFMSKTIDDFRNFFKPSKTKGPVDILTSVISAVKLMEAQMRHNNINLTVKNMTGSNTLIVYGYQGEFIHVLVNILANAKDAILENINRTVGLTVRSIDIIVSANGDNAVIEIIDSGGGIPEQLLPKIFNPYYTTKGTSSGTGMGLYMSKMIVEKEMRGELRAENTKGGARFMITLKRMVG